MRLKKAIILLTVFVLFSLASFGQGGSNYSIFGIGDIISNVSSTYDGIAGTSIAIPSDYAINTRNPAMWSLVTTTRLQAGYHFNQNVIQNDKLTLWQNNGKASGILGIFSVDTAMGLSFSFGVHPYSSVNYLLTTPFEVDADGVKLSGTTTYQGNGGLSLGYLGGSVNLMQDLSIGAEIFGSFGFINTSNYTTIAEPNSYPSQNSISDNLYGYGLKGGLYYNVGKGLSLGAIFETHNSLTVDRTTKYYSYSLKDTSFSKSFDMAIPLSYGFGASYVTGKFLFGADLSMQDFSNFNYQKDAKTKFRNNMLYSFGVSRVGNRSPFAPIMDKIAYNLGFGYKQLYYSVNNIDINEYFGSIGFEIPISTGTMLNAAFQIGSRGTTDSKLVKENFGRFTIDISIGETWFKPFKREF